MLKVFLITALVGAVWAKGYPALKYEQTKIDEDDHGLIDEDEVRPQYMKPVHQTQVEYNDEQDLVVEDEPEDKYEQSSVEAFPKRSSSYGGKLKPEGKQGTYKGSDISSEIKQKKNSYESTKISQEEFEIKTISKDFGSRLPKGESKEYKPAVRAPFKGTYQKPQEEEEYSGHIGQNNAPQEQGIKQTYKPKSSYVTPSQEQVEVELKSQSTPYKGAKGKDNSGTEQKKIVYDSGMRPGHYGSQGVYMGYSQYSTKDGYKDAALDDKQKYSSYNAPKTYGIYREGPKHKYSSHGSESSHKGHGNTGYHSGHSGAGSYHQSGLSTENHEQKKEESGYGTSGLSKNQKSYGGSGSGYSGIGGASANSYQGSKSIHGASGHGVESGSGLQSGLGYKSQVGSYNGYKASEEQGQKNIGSSGYGVNTGSHLLSGSGYKSNYGTSQEGYKAAVNHGIKSSGASGYGVSAGSHLKSDSGYKSHYGGSHTGHKASGNQGYSGYGFNAGSHLQSGSGYRGHHGSSHNGYSTSGNTGIKSHSATGYGLNAGSNLQSGSGYRGYHGSSHNGYSTSGNTGIKSHGATGHGLNAGSNLQSGSGYQSHNGASHSGFKYSGNNGIKTNSASGYRANSGSHLNSGLGQKSSIKTSGLYGQSSSGHLGYGIGGQSQHQTSTYSGLGKQHGNNFGSGYAHGHISSGVSADSGSGKITSNYGSSNLGGHGYERGHQRNVGKSYHTTSNNYSPASYQNSKHDEYNQKSVKSSGIKGTYAGGIGGSDSGIKSSSGYQGSNAGVLSSVKGSYQQSKVTQEKQAEDSLSSGVSDEGSSYKGIGESPKEYPAASKTNYPKEPQTKSSGSGIKGGPKSPKYPVEHQGILGSKSHPSHGGSGSYGASPASTKGYAPKGVKGGSISGGLEQSDKKSQYQPITSSQTSGGYHGPSHEQPEIGSVDQYEPKKIEQKDLSYEAVLGSPGSSNSGSGSGGYGFGPSDGSSSSSSGPVYGSDDKYEMSKPMPYEFKYDIKDEEHGADQYREEKMDDNGYLTGRYGYKDPYGLYRQVEYQASKDGFKVSSIKTNEPGTDNEDPADVHFEVEKNYQSQY